MTSWAGFWIGCGIAIFGLAIADIGDAMREISENWLNELFGEESNDE